jgi:hypothetical protein
VCSTRLRKTETIEGHEGSGEYRRLNGHVELALRFAELAKFDNDAFERLTRYETALWAAHPLVALNFTVRHETPFRGDEKALSQRKCSQVDLSNSAPEGGCKAAVKWQKPRGAIDLRRPSSDCEVK